MRFKGKRALVTGAAGGIGKVISQMLRAEGARVAAADRNCDAVDAEVRISGNLLDPAYADALPRTAAKALGGLDIIINNAGVITRGPVTETSDQDGFDPATAIAELGRTVPLGRVALPDDIADVVLFLASDAARYMCGSLVEVNGGKPVS